MVKCARSEIGKRRVECEKAEHEKTERGKTEREKAGRVSVRFRQFIPLKVATTHSTSFQNASSFPDKLTQTNAARAQARYSCNTSHVEVRHAFARNRMGENLKDSRYKVGERGRIV
jgi:hypothetical protein